MKPAEGAGIGRLGRRRPPLPVSLTWLRNERVIMDEDGSSVALKRKQNKQVEAIVLELNKAGGATFCYPNVRSAGRPYVRPSVCSSVPPPPSVGLRRRQIHKL